MMRFIEDLACAWGLGMLFVAFYLGCAVLGVYIFVADFPPLRPIPEILSGLVWVGAVPGFAFLLMMRR